MNIPTISKNVNPDAALARLRHAYARLIYGTDRVTAEKIIRRIMKREGKGVPNFSSVALSDRAPVLLELRTALALELAKVTPVFPLQPERKDPWTPHGHLDATQDAKVIRKWTKTKPNCNWGSVAAVADVDTKIKPGKTRGTETWAALIAEPDRGEPDTRKVKTPTDGSHYYVADDLAKGGGKLGDGVDVPNYVVSPGSHVTMNSEDIRATGFYQLTADKPIISIPWLAAVAGTRPEPAKTAALLTEPLFDAAAGAAMLAKLDPENYQDEDTFTPLSRSYHYATAGQGYDEFKEWAARGGEYNFKGRWDSYGKDPTHITDEHVFFEAVTNAGGAALVAKIITEAEFSDPVEPFVAMESEPDTKIDPTPWVYVDPASIKPRDWIYGMHYIRKYTSATISPGGGGKTTLILAEAVSMATGIDFLEVGRMYPRPVKVWYWNGEDPAEEVQRRLGAILKHYEIDRSLLEGRLFIDSGRDLPIKIATETDTGTRIAVPLINGIIAAVQANEIDVLVIDPFVASHSVSENDNVKIDEIIKSGWNVIAEQGNCAPELAHHTRKAGPGQQLTAADARGASAIVDGTRSVRVLNTMTAEQANILKIKTDRWRFFRLDNGKPNMAVRGDGVWRMLLSVDLGNAADGMPSDSVGVVAPWVSIVADPLVAEIIRDKIIAAVGKLIAAGKRITRERGGDYALKGTALLKHIRTVADESQITTDEIVEAVTGAFDYQEGHGRTKASFIARKATKPDTGDLVDTDSE